MMFSCVSLKDPVHPIFIIGGFQSGGVFVPGGSPMLGNLHIDKDVESLGETPGS